MTDGTPIDGEKLYAKVAWRIIPFAFLLYIIAFIDRTNVSIAKLKFQGDLGLSNEMYGIGAGLFFIGYFLFEVPSNLILQRVGARIWIARIMISWGIVSSCFMFMDGKASFYFLRFMLGVTEAGFFPGLILYLSYWFPVRRRARVVGAFMTAIPMSWVIGAPLSGEIMDRMHNVMGMTGWRWMFLLEGLPAIVLGVSVLWLFTDRPQKATWLTPAERDWIDADLAIDQAIIAEGGRKDFKGAFTDYRIWWLVALYLTNVMANYGLPLWMPQVIKDSDPTLSDRMVGWLCIIPWAVTATVMMANGWHSDRQNERRWHIAIPHFIAAIGILGAGMSLNNTPQLIFFLCVTLAGVNSALGVFWALPAAFITGAAAAGGIAVINSVGNLGGYVGPDTIGKLKDTYGFNGGFLAIAASLCIGAILVLLFPVKKSS